MKTLDEVTLSPGKHMDAEEGMCLLELTSYLAGEPFTDRPVCASPVLAAFGRALNDGFVFEDHLEALKPFAPLLLGTVADREVEERRMWLLVDWSIRTILPLVFDAALLSEVAARLRALPPVVDRASATGAEAASAGAAESAARAAESAAWAAESTAWAAWAAARAAPRAAESAAGAAARAVARAVASIAWSADVATRSGGQSPVRFTRADARAATIAMFAQAIALQ